jgi:hypothetical protein
LLLLVLPALLDLLVRGVISLTYRNHMNKQNLAKARVEGSNPFPRSQHRKFQPGFSEHTRPGLFPAWLSRPAQDADVRLLLRRGQGALDEAVEDDPVELSEEGRHRSTPRRTWPTARSGGEELTPDERLEVDQLRARDCAVRAHEQDRLQE